MKKERDAWRWEGNGLALLGLSEVHKHGGDRVRMLELSPTISVLGSDSSLDPGSHWNWWGAEVSGIGGCCFAEGREEWFNFLPTEGSWERRWWTWYSMGTRRENKEKGKQTNKHLIKGNSEECIYLWELFNGMLSLHPLTPTIFDRDHTFQGMLAVVGFLTETGEEAKFSASAGVGSALQMREETWHVQWQASCA